jgi:lysophospholipase L1-like esterase
MIRGAPAKFSPPEGESDPKRAKQELVCLLAQLLLMVCTAVLGVWLRLPQLCLFGIILTGIAATIGGIAEAKEQKAVVRWTKIIVAANAVWIPIPFLLPQFRLTTLDVLFAIPAWLVAATIFIPNLLAKKSQENGSEKSPSNAQSALNPGWNQLSLVWAAFGTIIWLAASYSQNQALAFHVGLVICIALLLLFKSWFRLPTIVIQFVNTCILLSIGLPLVDFFLRPSNHLDLRPETRKRYYSYDVAKKNPVAFTSWWKYYNEQWDQFLKSIAIPDPSGLTPYRLRPGGTGNFFQSHVTINSKGFRGKEIPVEKGNAFRIVAIGESTTFGVTMNADDKPWPEVLEEMIRTRLQPSRPVEVINAGVPAHTLEHTLSRFQKDILPLKPDMIICYHGFNGFNLLFESLPHVTGPRPPKYQPRPLKILADVEHRVKMTRYRNALLAPTQQNPPRAIDDPMTSRYALAYRHLIEAARTNNIRLAISTFSMAANTRSDNAILEFYRPGFPLVHWQVQANALHAGLVRQFAMENPEIDLVDTQPKLDGYHEKFIDLMHLTQEGNQEVAEAFFAGIKKTLQESLTPAAEREPAVGK